MITLQGRAYGKLNLTLDILGRRPDGYHDLEMVMCSVSLCDEITVRLDTGEPWSVTCDRPGIPDGPDNLCWKAAKAYLDAADLAPEGVSVAIRKSIPAWAGMALQISMRSPPGSSAAASK